VTSKTPATPVIRDLSQTAGAGRDTAPENAAPQCTRDTRESQSCKYHQRSAGHVQRTCGVTSTTIRRLVSRRTGGGDASRASRDRRIATASARISGYLPSSLICSLSSNPSFERRPPLSAFLLPFECALLRSRPTHTRLFPSNALKWNCLSTKPWCFRASYCVK